MSGGVLYAGKGILQTQMMQVKKRMSTLLPSSGLSCRMSYH